MWLVLLVAVAAVMLLFLVQARPALAPAGTLLPAKPADITSTFGHGSAPALPASNVATQRTISAPKPVVLPPATFPKVSSTNGCSTNGTPTMHPMCVTGGSIPIGG